METYAIHMLVRVFYYFFQLIIHTNETLGIRTWQHNQAILTLYNRKHCCYTIFRNESQKKSRSMRCVCLCHCWWSFRSRWTLWIKLSCYNHTAFIIAVDLIKMAKLKWKKNSLRVMLTCQELCEITKITTLNIFDIFFSIMLLILL